MPHSSFFRTMRAAAPLGMLLPAALAALLLAALFAPAALPAQAPVTIATYNSALMFDGEDNPATDDENFLEKEPASLEALADVIRATNADLVGMQELEGRPVLDKFVAHYLADTHYTVNFDAPAERTFNVALLSRYPVTKTINYGDTPGADTSLGWMQSRMVYFRVEVSPTYLVHVFVVHLKAQGDAKSVQTRATMTERLREWMTGGLGLDPGRDNIVVMGDMNDTPDSPAIKTILEIPGGGFVHIAAEEPNPDFTHSSAGPTREIDMILVSRAMSVEYIGQTSRVVSLPSPTVLQRASDHLPAVAAFVSTDLDAPGEAAGVLAGLDADGRAQVERLRGMENAAAAFAGANAREIAAASEGDASRTIAEALAEAKDYLARDAEPPVRVITGVVMTPTDRITDGRTQFSFMDPTGGVIVDERGTENFPTMPAIGDVVRIYGRVGEYREVTQFRPVRPVEIVGKQMFELDVPLLDFAELSQNGQRYLGAVVRVRARVVDRETVKPGVKLGLAPPDATAANPDLPLHAFVPKLAFNPANVAVGAQIVARGVVSAYGGVYQIQVLDEKDLTVISR